MRGPRKLLSDRSYCSDASSTRNGTRIEVIRVVTRNILEGAMIKMKKLTQSGDSRRRFLRTLGTGGGGAMHSDLDKNRCGSCRTAIQS
jgi:hypothetical protein